MAFCAALYYRFPSRHLRVVGVTGTTGKTSVVVMAAHALRANGLRVGYTSTALFSDGKQDWLNDKKMTMVGRFFTQKMLRAMVKNGCDVALIETTSEGAVQFRHRFIHYDAMVITGLYPEHIESHGGFDNYKKAKQALFAHLQQCRQKYLHGTPVSKTAILNCDDRYAHEFCLLSPAQTMGFTTTTHACGACADMVVPYTLVGLHATGVRMRFAGHMVQLKVLGAFNVVNAAAAGCVCIACGIDAADAARALETIEYLPGRIERIDEGQDFTVIVDYAFEPNAVETLDDTIAVLQPQRVIHVLGSAGGGRDRARRHALGFLAGTRADYVIITNEDPYDEDPQAIIREVAHGAVDAGKTIDGSVVMFAQREDAIAHAVAIARSGDVVLITGKGCEQAIAGPHGRLTPWDDRVVARDALRRRKPTTTPLRASR